MAEEYVPYEGPCVTRAQAQASGSKHYFDDSPCIRGHIAPRYVSTGSCLACAKLYNRKALAVTKAKKAADPAFRAAQQAKQRIRGKRWEETHREQIRERARKRSREHPERARLWNAKPENRAKKNARTAELYQRKKAADPDALRAKWRAYHAANKEASAAATKRWYQKNWDAQKAKRDAEREIRAVRSAAWAKANPTRVSAKTRAWQARNPGSTQRWRKANPEANTAIKHRRRARERSAEGSYTVVEVKDLFQRQSGKCVHCTKSLRNGYHVDHIVPLVRSGTNWITNIQLLCGPCNVRKGATDPIEFARRNGRLL